MTTKNINLIPASQFSEHQIYRYETTLSRNQCLFFSRETIELYNLAKGVFKFYLDPPNNIIGWSVVRSGKLDTFKRTKGQGIKKIYINPKSGIGTINIAIELKKMNLDTKKITTKKHSVQQHENKGLLVEDNIIDFIELDEYSKNK